MNPLQEAEIKVPPKYVIVFSFRDGTKLTLPFSNEDTATTAIKNLMGVEGLVVIYSAEPIPSIISREDLICATPGKFESE